MKDMNELNFHNLKIKIEKKKRRKVKEKKVVASYSKFMQDYLNIISIVVCNYLKKYYG